VSDDDRALSRLTESRPAGERKNGIDWVRGHIAFTTMYLKLFDRHGVNIHLSTWKIRSVWEGFESM
jgi:hypothetical protein